MRQDCYIEKRNGYDIIGKQKAAIRRAAIKNHCAEELTPERIADYFGLSHYYLSHIFKWHTNVSLMRFILLAGCTRQRKCSSKRTRA